MIDRITVMIVVPDMQSLPIIFIYENDELMYIKNCEHCAVQSLKLGADTIKVVTDIQSNKECLIR